MSSLKEAERLVQEASTKCLKIGNRRLRINFAPVGDNDQWPPSCKESERPPIPVKPASLAACNHAVAVAKELSLASARHRVWADFPGYAFWLLLGPLEALKSKQNLSTWGQKLACGDRLLIPLLLAAGVAAQENDLPPTPREIFFSTPPAILVRTLVSNLDATRWSIYQHFSLEVTGERLKGRPLIVDGEVCDASKSISAALDGFLPQADASSAPMMSSDVLSEVWSFGGLRLSVGGKGSTSTMPSLGQSEGPQLTPELTDVHGVPLSKLPLPGQTVIQLTDHLRMYCDQFGKACESSDEWGSPPLRIQMQQNTNSAPVLQGIEMTPDQLTLHVLLQREAKVLKSKRWSLRSYRPQRSPSIGSDLPTLSDQGAVWHSKPPQPLGQPRSAERYALLAPLELFGAKAEASAALRRVAPEAVELRLEEAYAAVAQEQWYLDRRDVNQPHCSDWPSFCPDFWCSSDSGKVCFLAVSHDMVQKTASSGQYHKDVGKDWQLYEAKAPGNVGGFHSCCVDTGQPGSDWTLVARLADFGCVLDRTAGVRVEFAALVRNDSASLVASLGGHDECRALFRVADVHLPTGRVIMSDPADLQDFATSTSSKEPDEAIEDGPCVPSGLGAGYYPVVLSRDSSQQICRISLVFHPLRVTKISKSFPPGRHSEKADKARPVLPSSQRSQAGWPKETAAVNGRVCEKAVGGPLHVVGPVELLGANGVPEQDPESSRAPYVRGLDINLLICIGNCTCVEVLDRFLLDVRGYFLEVDFDRIRVVDDDVTCGGPGSSISSQAFLGPGVGSVAASVKPGIQFVASLGQPSTVGTMEVQDARGYHPELRAPVGPGVDPTGENASLIWSDLATTTAGVYRVCWPTDAGENPVDMANLFPTPPDEVDLNLTNVTNDTNFSWGYEIGLEDYGPAFRKLQELAGGTNGSNNSNSSQGPQSLMMPISMLHCAWQFVSDFFAAKIFFSRQNAVAFFTQKVPVGHSVQALELWPSLIRCRRTMM
eukprot:symbB.v1.2.029959.t1/scaffold3328.1/size58959/4